MSLTNKDVAKELREIYTLMQLAGENRFRAIAFDRAAQSIDNLNEDIQKLIDREKVTDIKGIGKSIAEDIYKLSETGSIPVLESLKEKVPAELIKWLDISGLGPKNAYKIHKELGLTTVKELKEACENGQVASLKGLGKKSAQKIASSIEWMQQFDERCRLDQALSIAKEMVGYLEQQKGVDDIEIAGSLRRAKETIGDVDILIGADKDHSSSIFDAFVSHPLVVEVLGKGDTKSSIRTENGRQVDLRIVNPEQFPAALMYFTGSKEHNVILRQRARERGLSLNEYGLFELDDQGNTNFNAPKEYSSEKDIYQYLDLSFIPPELREGTGEDQYFEHHESMELLKDDHIKGVIHAHSTYSDGKNSIAEMAEACIAKGYQYLVLTDHSQTASYAGGLTVDDLQKQWDEIDTLNEHFKEQGTDFKIYKAIESDILSDGSLDYDEDLLEQFDLIIGSMHYGMDMPREKIMKRLSNAIKNPYTRIIGHPTGRLLLRREGSDLDMNAIIELAARNNTVIEINANPRRLDLDWRHGNKAKEAGLMTSINPDAHTVEGIEDIRYGVMIARKAKFSPDRVLNTKTRAEFEKWIHAD